MQQQAGSSSSQPQHGTAIRAPSPQHRQQSPYARAVSPVSSAGLVRRRVELFETPPAATSANRVHTPPKTSIRSSSPPPWPSVANSQAPSRPPTPAAQQQLADKTSSALQKQHGLPPLNPPESFAPPQHPSEVVPTQHVPPKQPAQPFVEEPPDNEFALRNPTTADEEARRLQAAAAAAAEAKAKHESFVAEQVRLMQEHERRQAEARLAEEMRIKEQLRFQLEEGGRALQRQREILDMENQQKELALQQRDVEAQQARQREEAKLELQRQQLQALRLQQERDLEAQRAKQREEAELELQHQQLLMFRQQQEQQRLWDAQQSQNQISYQQPSYQYQNQWQPTHYGPPYMNQSSGPPQPSQQTSPPIPSSQHVQPPGLQTRFRRPPDDDGDDEGGDDDDEYEDGDDQWAPARRRAAAATPSRDELRLLTECLKLTAGIKLGNDVTAYFRDVRESLYPAGDLVLASWDSSVATALESQKVFLKRETATMDPQPARGLEDCVTKRIMPTIMTRVSEAVRIRARKPPPGVPRESFVCSLATVLAVLLRETSTGDESDLRELKKRVLSPSVINEPSKALGEHESWLVQYDRAVSLGQLYTEDGRELWAALSSRFAVLATKACSDLTYDVQGLRARHNLPHDKSVAGILEFFAECARLHSQYAKSCPPDAADHRGAKQNKTPYALPGQAADKSKHKSLCCHCGRSGHADADCYFAKVPCLNCGIVGHIRPICKKPGDRKSVV